MADEFVRRQLVGMLSLGDIDLHASHELAGEIVEAVKDERQGMERRYNRPISSLAG